MASPAWRGYVNQILYGASLHQRVEDEVITHIAGELIRQWFFTLPVEDYYQAAVAALKAGEPIAVAPGQDEDAARDFLARLVRALDDRRPWPEPPFYEGDPSEWPALRDAPVIARIPLTEREVRQRINRMFAEIPPQVGDIRVLILRLRTGQTVALRADPPFREPGLTLLAHTDPSSTVDSFRELTGIETS